MIIGTFAYQRSQDTYSGTLSSLTADIKLSLAPVESKNAKSPSHRVFAETTSGKVECGAAWPQTSKAGQDYLAVRLDDPTWPKALSCALVPGENKDFILIWQRESAKPDRKAA